MWQWLKNLFGYGETEKPFSPDQVMDDDAVMREIVARAFNSKNMIIAHVDETGKIVYEEVKFDEC